MSMQPPADLPPRLRTDASNAFAHHTLAVRVPAILERVIEQNPDYPAAVLDSLLELRQAVCSNAPLPGIDAGGPHASDWQRALAHRQGERWLATDWFFAEHYLYRQLADATRFWETGRDPFAPIKQQEYASGAHAAALDAACEIGGGPSAALEALLGASLFGNRIDLSFAAALERGTVAAPADLLCDDRQKAVRSLLQGSGPVHVIIDNAGTELSVDLVLAARLIEWLAVDVILHLKVHPAFVSDALLADITAFIERGTCSGGRPSERRRALCGQLAGALARGQLALSPHPFWNGPSSLWEMPKALEQRFHGARLVVLKGDAHYRRALGDAIWPAGTSFARVTEYFPAPLLALRTLKSDPVVGLTVQRVNALDRQDPLWRVNGQRGVASLGGAAKADQQPA